LIVSPPRRSYYRTPNAVSLLYAILDLGYVDRDDIVAIAEELCSGGADILQLRAKAHPEAEILTLAREVRPVCADHGVPFIVNDFPEIAATVGADGVHIGQDDGDLADARRRAGGCRIVGRSTHSLAQAEAALAEGADYIGFGPLHATATKPGRPAIGLGDIEEAHRRVAQIPIYCIGGITLENLPAVVAAGARNVVIVSDLLQSGDIPSYIRRAKALLPTAS
jgi:thiamine-phosphate pyrophosphorylase